MDDKQVKTRAQRIVSYKMGRYGDLIEMEAVVLIGGI